MAGALAFAAQCLRGRFGCRSGASFPRPSLLLYCAALSLALLFPRARFLPASLTAALLVALLLLCALQGGSGGNGGSRRATRCFYSDRGIQHVTTATTSTGGQHDSRCSTLRCGGCSCCCRGRRSCLALCTLQALQFALPLRALVLALQALETSSLPLAFRITLSLTLVHSLALLLALSFVHLLTKLLALAFLNSLAQRTVTLPLGARGRGGCFAACRGGFFGIFALPSCSQFHCGRRGIFGFQALLSFVFASALFFRTSQARLALPVAATSTGSFVVCQFGLVSLASRFGSCGGCGTLGRQSILGGTALARQSLFGRQPLCV
jgi:hypothetical protein